MSETTNSDQPQGVKTRLNLALFAATGIPVFTSEPADGQSAPESAVESASPAEGAANPARPSEAARCPSSGAASLFAPFGPKEALSAAPTAAAARPLAREANSSHNNNSKAFRRP